MKIFRFVHDIFSVSARADRIKSDETLRRKSARFAVTCIIYSLFTAAFAGVAAWLFKTYIKTEELSDIIAIVFAAILALCAASCLIGAVVRLVAQFTINRSVWTWIAFAVFLAAAATAVILFVVL